MLLIVPCLLFGYENLTPAPEGLGDFFSWLFSTVKTVQGQGWTVMTAFVLTGIVGLFKLTPLKIYFDKLGKWKFILIMALGAGAELLFNIPRPFTFSGVISVIITGASGTGALSIAFHHIIDKLKPEKKK